MELEYRLCVRKPVNLSVTVQDELGATAILNCLDLCAVGAALDTSDFRLLKGSSILLEFDLSNACSCAVKAKVVRQSSNEAGVSFDEFDAFTFDNLVKWLYPPQHRNPGRVTTRPFVPQEV